MAPLLEAMGFERAAIVSAILNTQCRDVDTVTEYLLQMQVVEGNFEVTGDGDTYNPPLEYEMRSAAVDSDDGDVDMDSDEVLFLPGSVSPDASLAIDCLSGEFDSLSAPSANAADSVTVGGFGETDSTNGRDLSTPSGEREMELVLTSSESPSSMRVPNDEFGSPLRNEFFGEPPVYDEVIAVEHVGGSNDRVIVDEEERYLIRPQIVISVSSHTSPDSCGALPPPHSSSLSFRQPSRYGEADGVMLQRCSGVDSSDSRQRSSPPSAPANTHSPPLFMSTCGKHSVRTNGSSNSSSSWSSAMHPESGKFVSEAQNHLREIAHSFQSSTRSYILEVSDLNEVLEQWTAAEGSSQPSLGPSLVPSLGRFLSIINLSGKNDGSGYVDSALDGKDGSRVSNLKFQLCQLYDDLVERIREHNEMMVLIVQNSTNRWEDSISIGVRPLFGSLYLLSSLFGPRLRPFLESHLIDRRAVILTNLLVELVNTQKILLSVQTQDSIRQWPCWLAPLCLILVELVKCIPPNTTINATSAIDGSRLSSMPEGKMEGTLLNEKQSEDCIESDYVINRSSKHEEAPASEANPSDDDIVTAFLTGNSLEKASLLPDHLQSVILDLAIDLLKGCTKPSTTSSSTITTSFAFSNSVGVAAIDPQVLSHGICSDFGDKSVPPASGEVSCILLKKSSCHAVLLLLHELIMSSQVT